MSSRAAIIASTSWRAGEPTRNSVSAADRETAIASLWLDVVASARSTDGSAACAAGGSAAVTSSARLAIAPCKPPSAS